MLPSRGNQQRYSLNVKFSLKIPQKEINPSIWQHCAGVRALAFGIGGVASKWLLPGALFHHSCFFFSPKRFLLAVAPGRFFIFCCIFVSLFLGCF
jgi:hypothetical protein